jgi:hypothetical protein
MEIVFLDLATVALELGRDVRLRLADRVGSRRTRTEFDQVANVFESAGTVKAVD